MLNGHPRVVPDTGLAAAKSIKQTTFACVGVSDQGDGRGAIGRCAVGHTIDPLLGPFDANASGFDSSEAQSVPDDGEFDGIAHRGLSDHFDNFAGDQSHFEKSGGDRIVSFDVENGPVLAFLQIIQSDRDHGRGLRAGSDLRLGRGKRFMVSGVGQGFRRWSPIGGTFSCLRLQEGKSHRGTAYGFCNRSGCRVLRGGGDFSLPRKGRRLPLRFPGQGTRRERLVWLGREPWRGGEFSMFGGTIRPESRSTIKLILIETEFQQAIPTRKSDLKGIFFNDD